MSDHIIKKGNTDVHDIAIYDKNGVLLTTLATASAIKFQIKATEDGVALVSKTLASGIEVDTPSTGYLRITLTASDTTQTPGTYFMGLQITWPSGEVREVAMEVDGVETEMVQIAQDVVNT